MKTATGNAVLRAYSQAVKNVMINEMTLSSQVSAGFTIPNGEKNGWQVSVKVSRFDADLLEREPMTGGLVENKKDKP